MNLPQLCQYSEGLAKMLASGIDIRQALRVAGRCMAARENRRFAARMAQALLSGDDLPEKEFSGSLPPFTG